MKTDAKEFLNDDEADPKDPIILAYRLNSQKSKCGPLYVKRSELKNDPDLIPFDNDTFASDFDPEEALSQIRQKEVVLDPDSHVYDKIKYKLMLDEVRKHVRSETISLKKMSRDRFDIKSIDEPAAHILLALVTKELKQNGLWIDEYEDLTMTEAFPLAQCQDDPRLKDLPTEDYEYGTFYEEEDLTHQDYEIESDQAEIASKGIHFPKPPTPMLYNLMRSSPEDLKHQIARRMIDSGYFEENEEDQALFPACFFLSRAVEEEWHFQNLMDQGLELKFPHYTFEAYKVDKIRLQKRIRFFTENFFSQNPRVKRFLKKSKDLEKQNPKKFWKRFNSVWEKLTIKQKNVLTKIYLQETPLTYEEAAEDFKISVDSVRSRIKGAVQRFKKEFPELKGISPKSSPQSELTGAYTLNYLWHYGRASKVAKLFRIDPKTNMKTKLIWNKEPKEKKLDWKALARIKAQIIENCPIPYFHETDYFDGTKPTILSFGRLPGNLVDDTSNEDKDSDYFE